MTRLTFRPSRPSLLPTAVFELFDRSAVSDAMREAMPAAVSADPAIEMLEVLDALDALGGEGLNTLHLSSADLALAVDRDLHTSSSWMASALFDAMDRTRDAA